MYLARNWNGTKPRYSLRRSLISNGDLTHQELMDLGPDPSRYLVYPGGNAFFVDPAVEDALAGQGITVDSDTLENLFWPFVRQEVRMAVETFRCRSSRKKSRLDPDEIQAIRFSVPAFDKRRLHYLKFGNMDQGPVAAMPDSLFRNLPGKSRDELEQGFLVMEQALKSSELKSYVYAAFNLQQFFQGFLTRGMPQAMDQDKVEGHFLEEVCRLNRFLFKTPDRDGLSPYLIRYVIMFFDHDYAHSTVLDEFARDFMARHRHHRPPKPARTLSDSAALDILQLTREEFDTMNRRGLIRHYRTMARKVHPDAGGDHETFVATAEAFQTLLAQKS